MTESWNDHAECWGDNADVNLYADRAFTSLVAQIDIVNANRKSKRVLDFGCGTGLLAERVAPYVHELVAVDTSEKMIAVLKSKDIRKVAADNPAREFYESLGMAPCPERPYIVQAAVFNRLIEETQAPGPG